MFGIVTASSSELLAQAVSVLQGTWPLVILAVGIPLGFYVVKKLIGLLPKR